MSRPEYLKETNQGVARQILQEICDQYNHMRLGYTEVKEAIKELEGNIGEDDFIFDFDGNKYRIIKDSAIWDIYVDEIKNTVEECYDLELDKIPSFIVVRIDWEQTAQNAYVDGYGHQFASYDSEEYEAAGYWIFRTN